jgi:hypothetical protein
MVSRLAGHVAADPQLLVAGSLSPASAKRGNASMSALEHVQPSPVWGLGYLQATVAVNRSVYLWQS